MLYEYKEPRVGAPGNFAIHLVVYYNTEGYLTTVCNRQHTFTLNVLLRQDRTLYGTFDIRVSTCRRCLKRINSIYQPPKRIRKKKNVIPASLKRMFYPAASLIPDSEPWSRDEK